MIDANLIEIFCILNEFCKYFVHKQKNTLDTSVKHNCNRPYLISNIEVMTILILFHTMLHPTLSHSISTMYATICAENF